MFHAGKEGPEFMDRVVYANLGRRTPTLLDAPRRGGDNAVISVGGKRVMILTVDPVSAIPSFGMELSAWLSVHLVASDYTTSGLRPEYATFSFNFPPEMTSEDRELYLRSVSRRCRNLGIAIAAGHTGSYPGSGFTVIGAGTMFGFATEGEYVTTAMSNPGDAILMTKSAAIEAAASLALSFPRHVDRKVGVSLATRARKMAKLCSTVDDALLAAKVGLGNDGVTSMHDATEGGVLGGLQDMAHASGRAFLVEEDKIVVSREAASVCGAFGIDPLSSLSEGTLLITCAQGSIDEICTRLDLGGIPARQIGVVRKGAGLWLSKTGRKPRLEKERRDGYWKAYDNAVRKRLR